MHHLGLTPHWGRLAQRTVNGLGLACTVDLYIDHDVVGIVGRSEDQQPRTGETQHTERDHELGYPDDQTAAKMETACPSAMGGRACRTAPLRRSCKPKATANSQPIAGLRPW